MVSWALGAPGNAVQMFLMSCLLIIYHPPLPKKEKDPSRKLSLGYEEFAAIVKEISWV